MKRFLTVLALGFGFAFAPALASADGTKIIYTFVRSQPEAVLGPDFADRMVPDKSMHDILIEIIESLPSGTATATATKTADDTEHFVVGLAGTSKPYLYIEVKSDGVVLFQKIETKEDFVCALIATTVDATHALAAVVPTELLTADITSDKAIALLQPAKKFLEDLAQQ